MRKRVSQYLASESDAAPLAVFRIAFGLLMFASIVRFWANGWIEKLYLEPSFFFSYYGFEWVQPLGGYTYLIFIVCGLSALAVSAGYRYRIAMVTFFLSFTYIELMDKTTYLNHYYFISVISFLMIFLPAHAYYSVDAYRNQTLRSDRIPRWCIDTIKLMVGIVYVYAGLAKLNSDWLLEAMPLKIWLPARYAIPILGDLLQKEWVHYFFSWSGAFYDLTIPFLLLYKRTRPVAFALVVVFHVLTRILFPIGMFPYIMIATALIFFDASLHHKILGFISRLLNIKKKLFDRAGSLMTPPPYLNNIRFSIISLFFIIQLLVPFRYLLYPGELFWTEEGFRFSWRVMLMEKRGYAQFQVENPDAGTKFYVDNTRFLTPLQEKQMSTQPDFILEYAHFLEDYYQKQGIESPRIFVESYVALNGRRSRPYIDPSVDLTEIERSFKHKSWILPFNETIKGL